MKPRCLLLAVAAWILGILPTGADIAGSEAGYLYLSPLPNASYLSPQNRYILVRFETVAPTDVTNLTSFITVTGANSGQHSGATHIASDGRTVIFEMSQDFSNSELVTVSLNPQLDPAATGTVDPYQYQFMVNGLLPGSPSPLLGRGQMAAVSDAVEASSPATNQSAQSSSQSLPEGAVIMPNGVSVPSDFPGAVVTVNDNPSPGYLFIENGWPSGAPPYTMILDDTGSPVWYRRGRVWDFKVQRNGKITWCVDRNGGFLSFDQNFNYIQSHHTVNGYLTDYHDFEMLEDGTCLMLGSRTHAADLSQHYPGGNPSANVIEWAIQEFTAAGELIFQWRAWDHFDIADNHGSVDFCHMNALDVDDDGHLLLSSRHMFEATKIDRDNGEIIWRLSGDQNDFTFVNDPLNGFVDQHDINAVGNGRYTVFANQGGLTNGNQRVNISRAVEYQLDLTNMTATAVWEFRDTPDKYAYWMGNAQRLTNGNTLVNFVRPSYPPVIEVDENGVKQFELTLSPNTDHYRVFRFPWDGMVAVPYLIVESQADNVKLIFNKFGDHAVDHYRIYGGTSRSPTNVVATSTTTLKRVTNVVNGAVNYFRVTAVSTNGTESGFSNEESLLVNITLPGGNMVVNGDFALGSSAWTWTVTPPAAATLDVGGGMAHFQISSGGTYISDVQLSQAGMPLTQGKEYTLEFDAWSAVPRVFEAKVEENTANGINYSGIQPFTAVPVMTHYGYTFTMNSSSDNDAQVTFNGGASPHDVYVDNVSLVERVYAPGDFDWDGCVGFDDLQVLTGEWQDEATGLTADLNGDGKVDFADFVIFSEAWSGEGFCP